MRNRPLAATFAALAVALVLTATTDAIGQYQPHLRFRVIATGHFRIYYHQGEEPLARRLGGIAESVRLTLPARIRLRAPAVTHVVLANQDDDANGLASPLPYCTVRLTAAWPALSDLIGNTDDWLRLAFVHEYAHVLQLNQSVGWAEVARLLLGRSPVAFPNLFLPQWQIEGFATFWESRTTGLGRLAGGDSAEIVRGLARSPDSDPLDRVNGGAVDWPGGYAPYLEGAWFYDYLTRHFGEDAVGRLANVTAGRLPYLSSAATTRVFGKSLGELWKNFQQEMKQEAAALPHSSPTGRRLTRRGFFVTSPRFDDGGRSVVYSVRDPDRFPALMITDVASGATRSIADRIGGAQVTVRDGLLIFDRLELSDNVAWRSDLFTADRQTGRSTRLTRDARLLEPDLSPDRRRLVCLRMSEDGRRELVFFAVSLDGRAVVSVSPSTVPITPDERATYGAPRWSPDGRYLAVERRRLGGPSEIVVFDVADGREHVAASSARSRNLEPAWMPDGSTILFASDRFDRSFQVFAASVDGSNLRRVTAVVGGALYPEVSPDGRNLIYVGLGANGSDLFEMALDPARWDGVPPEPAAAATQIQAPSASEADGLMRDPPAPAVTSSYSPFPTLLPRAWMPLADTANGHVRAGLAVSGVDVLLRHSFEATLLWRFGDTNAIGGPHRGRPDWTAGYVYSRWRPAFFAVASDKTSFLTLSGGRPSPDAELRDQGLAAGITFPVRRVRQAQLWQAGFNLERDTFTITGAPSSRHRNAFRAAWAINTAQHYDRSISTEDGVAAAITSEQVRTAFGADGNADAFTAELRAFLRPAPGHSVLALRAGYGVAAGDTTVRRQFYLGGSSPSTALVDFGSDAFRMVRGFDNQVSAGSHVAVATVEWRQPAWRIERGWGTFPVFLRTLHGAVFVDAGHAWDSGFSVARVKTSVGVEASLDVVAGYRVPVTVTAGIASTRDGAASGRRGTGVYFRFGPSF
jgi:hypothetical protein